MRGGKWEIRKDKALLVNGSKGTVGKRWEAHRSNELNVMLKSARGYRCCQTQVNGGRTGRRFGMFLKSRLGGGILIKKMQTRIEEGREQFQGFYELVAIGLFLFCCCAGNWSQDLAHAGQALCHWATPQTMRLPSLNNRYCPLTWAYMKRLNGTGSAVLSKENPAWCIKMGGYSA